MINIIDMMKNQYLYPVTRCGYLFDIIDIDEENQIISGCIRIPIYSNDKPLKYYSMKLEWDAYGNSIKKEEYPTYYYYDLVLR